MLTTRNFKDLAQLTGGKLVFWLHDMILFTGGCHYAWECVNYMKDCGYCPALYSNDQYDQSFKNLSYKKKVFFDFKDFKIVAISSYAANQAKKSSLLNECKIDIALNPIDFTIFKPIQDRLKLRKKLKHSAKHKILFFGAADLADERKGFDYFIKSLFELKKILKQSIVENVFIIFLGKNLPNIKIPFNYNYAGVVKNDKKIANLYQVSDYFICTSLADSGNLMLSQSLACGVPVITFNSGVAEDLIENDWNGYVLNENDPQDLANKIKYVLLLDNKYYMKLSQNAYRMARKKLSTEEHLKHFIQ